MKVLSLLACIHLSRTSAGGADIGQDHLRSAGVPKPFDYFGHAAAYSPSSNGFLSSAVLAAPVRSSENVLCEDVKMCFRCDGGCKWCSPAIDGVDLAVGHCQSAALDCNAHRYESLFVLPKLTGAKVGWTPKTPKDAMCRLRTVPSIRPVPNCAACQIQQRAVWCQADLVENAQVKGSGGLCLTIEAESTLLDEDIACFSRNSLNLRDFLTGHKVDEYLKCPAPRCSSHSTCYDCRKERCFWCGAEIRSVSSPSQKGKAMGKCVPMPTTIDGVDALCANVPFNEMATDLGFKIGPTDYKVEVPKDRLKWQTCPPETCGSITSCSSCNGSCKWCAPTLDGLEFEDNLVGFYGTEMGHCQESNVPCNKAFYGSLDGFFTAGGRTFGFAANHVCWKDRPKESPLVSAPDCATCRKTADSKWCQIELKDPQLNFKSVGGLCFKKTSFYPSINCIDRRPTWPAPNKYQRIWKEKDPHSLEELLGKGGKLAGGKSYEVKELDDEECQTVVQTINQCSMKNSCKSCHQGQCVWCGATIKDVRADGTVEYRGTQVGKCVPFPTSKKASDELCANVSFSDLAKVLDHKQGTHDYKLETAKFDTSKGWDTCGEDTAASLSSSASATNCTSCESVSGTRGRWCEITKTNGSDEPIKTGVCLSGERLGHTEAVCHSFTFANEGSDNKMKSLVFSQCPNPPKVGGSMQASVSRVVFWVGCFICLLH